MIVTKTTKTDISKYCEECLKFRQGDCKGKSYSQKNMILWGRRVGKRFRAGLNFCRRYEFDERLYEFADGSGKVETIKVVRKRQAKKNKETANQKAFDDFDLAASLSSADFEI